MTEVTAVTPVTGVTESPDIVYGRLLESAHISGYGFERMCDGFEWLLEDDRWRKVGSGYDNVLDFMASVDVAAFNLDRKKRIIKRIKELEPRAPTRDIAKAAKTSQATVSRTLNGDSRESVKTESVTPEQDKRTATDSTESGGPSSLDLSPKAVADQARRVARKEAAAAETQARRAASRNAEPIPDGLDLRVGDARQVLADVPDASVSLVLTDPPYGDEAEPLYRWLAEWSARVLVPGGSLICYTGQSRLDRDIGIFASQLRYWWLLTMLHHQSQRLPGKFVTAEFKPVLWFVKDHRRGRTLVNDVLRSAKREKDDHDWGQGEGGVSLLIEQLTEPAEMIADPFAGTARWGQIAVGMGRRWVGADVQRGGNATVVT